MIHGSRRVRRVAVATCAAVIAAVATTACGSDATGPNASGKDTPVGSFALTTLDGKNLPAAMFSETNYKVEVTSASLDLTGDGKYTSVMTSRETVAGNVSTYVDTLAGRWTQAAANITFVSAEDGSQTTAAWGSNKLTLTTTDNVGPRTWIYMKK